MTEHPFIKDKKIPVYVANFVLMEYGTGAIFGCPGHDQRDLDFANKYNLPVIPVILPKDKTQEEFKVSDEAYVGDGQIINSDFLNGLKIEEGKVEVIKKLEKWDKDVVKLYLGLETGEYQGKDIDALSQFYIEDGKILTVPDSELPIKLPADIDLTKPGNPLENHPTWKFTKCPKRIKQPEKLTLWTLL